MKNKLKLPSDFFKQPRPKVSNKETFRDVVPIKWSKDVNNGNKQTVVYLKEEKN